MELKQTDFRRWFLERGTSTEIISRHWDQWDLIVNDIFRSGIKRQPEFFIQCAYESSYFRSSSENLNYSTANRILKVFRKQVRTLKKAKTLVRKPDLLAECVYGSRLGNDSAGARRLYKQGWSVFNFRGTGYIQLTGYNNWLDFKKQTGVDCFQDKEYFIKNPWQAAGFFWVRHRLDYLPGIREQTKAINGGYAGLPTRQNLYKYLLKSMK